MIEKIKKIDRWLVLSLGIVFAVFLLIALLNDHIFMFMGDILDQQLKMYIQGWERIRNGSLPFWDWTNFLGASYYSNNTFYFIGSPFFWLAMLMPTKEMILPFFLTMNGLKSLLCALFTFIWIKKVTKDSRAAFFASICFTFCAYNLFNYTNNHMLDAILFYPLCLYFVECFLQDNKFFALALTIGGIGIVNYYLLYLFIPFLFLYALFRCLFLLDKFDFKKVFIKGSQFVGLFIIGLLLCMVTLYPSFLALQGNARTSEMVISLSTIGKHNLYRWLTAFFSPICHWREDINYYMSNAIVEGIGWGGGMIIYTMLITPYLILASLVSKKSKETWFVYVLYAIYAVFSVFPFFYVLFNQNYESRWMITIVLINCLMIGVGLSRIKEMKNSSFVIAGAGVSAILVMFYFVTRMFGLNPYETSLQVILRNTLISIAIVAAYTLTFIFLKKKEKGLNLALVLILIVELGYSFGNFLFNDGWYLNFMNKEQLDNYGVYDSAVTDTIKEYDSGFYRIDVGSLQFVAINDAKGMNFNSFNTYHSMYNYNQNDFIFDRFVESGKWTFFPQRGKWQVKNLLSSKYWFTHAGEEVPFNTNSQLNYKDYPPYGYTYLTTVDGTDIYENQYFLPIAYVMDQTLSEEVFLQQSILDQDRLLNWYLITEDSENKEFEFKDNLIHLKGREDSSQQIDFTGKEGGYLYVTLTKDVKLSTRTKYYFYDTAGSVIKEGIRENEVSYFATEVPENAVSFKLDLPDYQFEMFYDDLKWYDSWYANASKEVIQDVVWTDNEVGGRMNVSEGRWIATSIPYDKGWRVLIDGAEIEMVKVNCGFIGFYLPIGEHYITFQYAPVGLLEGLIVSVITFIVFTMTVSTWKMKKAGKKYE